MLIKLFLQNQNYPIDGIWFYVFLNISHICQFFSIQDLHAEPVSGERFLLLVLMYYFVITLVKIQIILAVQFRVIIFSEILPWIELCWNGVISFIITPFCIMTHIFCFFKQDFLNYFQLFIHFLVRPHVHASLQCFISSTDIISFSHIFT